MSGLEVFTRQVLQLVPINQLQWPGDHELQCLAKQQMIWERCFRPQNEPFLPPVRYRYAVLKSLLAKIEKAFVDPDDYEVSDELITSATDILAGQMPSEIDAAQERNWVTYCVAPATTPISPDNAIRIHENRSVLAGSGTTGIRTWEASLHLCEYLLASPTASAWIRGRTVLELGAGTGILSMLCAGHLGAKKVFCTDGSEEVITAMQSNTKSNSGMAAIDSGVLRWGIPMTQSNMTDRIAETGVDTVLGADVTYDVSVIPALVATIGWIFKVSPSADVIVSATIRNSETFAAFEQACDAQGFATQEIHSPVVPSGEQYRLFYSSTVPTRILHIKGVGSDAIEAKTG